MKAQKLNTNQPSVLLAGLLGGGGCRQEISTCGDGCSALIGCGADVKIAGCVYQKAAALGC